MDTIETKSSLVSSISISDLLSNKGMNFEIEGKANREFDDSFYDFDLDNDDDYEDDKVKLPNAPWLLSFDVFREEAEKVNEFIYKRIIKFGLPDPGLVPENANVKIHYSAYEESVSRSYDSTFSRHPKKFCTGKGEVLCGLEQAVRTMLKGEKSQFVISYNLLFGEMGCAPRIKPKCDFLYEIEVLSFIKVLDGDIYNEIPEDSRNKFYLVFPKVKETYKNGLEYLRCGNLRTAIKQFSSGLNAIELCQLANENEEKQQKKLLTDLYTNLCICYSDLNMPKKVCLMCNELRKNSNIDSNFDALFHEGKALRILGDFQKARVSLLKAKRLNPSNRDLIVELEIFEKTYKSYTETNKLFSQRALGIMKRNDQKSIAPEKNGSLTNEIKEQLLKCKISEAEPVSLPEGLAKEKTAVYKH